MGWDVFLSYASEDKDGFAAPLRAGLEQVSLSVWFDDRIEMGNSIRSAIDRGLTHSRFGVVLLSPRYFSRRWPQSELDALMGKERNGQDVILPVWLDLDEQAIRGFSPLMAARRAAKWSEGLDAVVSYIVAATQGVAGENIPESASKITSAGVGGDDLEQVVMLARNKEGPIFISCPKLRSGETIELDLDPGDENGSTWLRNLQADSDPVLGYAFDLDAGLASLEAVELEKAGGTSLWRVSLKREQRTYGADSFEPGFNALTTADLARMRARRILLDETLSEASKATGNDEFKETLELFIRGLSSPVKTIGSPFPAFFRDLRHKPTWFLQVCRLFAVYLLRVTGTVEKTLRLQLALEGEALRVEFEGVRPRVYENQEPEKVAVSGICKLLN